MRLREQIVKANLLVREASYIAEELDKRTEYKVTLQIPASSLDANRKRGSLLSEPAIQVRRKGKGKQIWSLEKLDNRLLDMRDLYQEWKECEEDTPVIRSYFKRADPFFDEQENHSLIGVANVFLESLFYDVKLQYAVPIVNQKGEVAGRLHVEVMRISGDIGERIAGGDDATDVSFEKETQDNKLVCMVKILQATGLPQHLSHFVFCKYDFWDQQEPVIVAPEVDTSSSPVSKEPQCMVVFDHCNEFSVSITEDFIEHLSEGALAIEIYGHKMNDPRKNPALWDLGIIQAKTRSLRDRWSEVTRKVEFWVQILEQNENGEYCPVEVISAKDVPTGGIFQLRQEEEEDMDSYQDRDLERLRRKWLNALTKRQEYLDQQLQKLVSKHDKTEDDADREAQLLEMRLTLTEERNAVMVPSAGSGIPGAPAEWTPVPGMETHIPVIFLDLNADDFSSQDNLDDPEAGGWDATLTGEEEDEFFELQIVRQHDGEVKAEASWDSAVHSCPQLSKGTPADERVFLIVRVTVQLSHPADMQLVLRKRICVSVHGRQVVPLNLSYYTVTTHSRSFRQLSIPQDAQGVEERETLARMAANVENTASADSEAYIEKYLRSVLAVENLLTLDRLRQEVAVKEQLTGRGKLGKRSLSSPNVNRLSGSRQDLIPSYSLGSNKMPKLLKSLFPVRDEKRGKQPSARAHQPVPRITVQSALPEVRAPRMAEVSWWEQGWHLCWWLPHIRIHKVRTSELKSFTRMLGGDPGGPSGTEEDPLASGGLGNGSAGGQALGKLEVSSDSEEASEVPEWLKEGEYVTVGTNKTGIVRYVGPTNFQEGTWVGVELDLPSGLSSPDPRGLWGAVGAAVPDAQPGQREQEGEKTRPMGVAVARLGLRGGPGVLSEGIKL
ncbi:kinesin family member 13B [Camelus ferus]|nr:kinesin family member 13B [Camelus ferus]